MLIVSYLCTCELLPGVNATAIRISVHKPIHAHVDNTLASQAPPWVPNASIFPCIRSSREPLRCMPVASPGRCSSQTCCILSCPPLIFLSSLRKPKRHNKAIQETLPDAGSPLATVACRAFVAVYVQRESLAGGS